MQVKRIWLTSESGNAQAIKLWEKYGFKNLEVDYLKNGYWVTKDLKGPGRDRIIFALAL